VVAIGRPFVDQAAQRRQQVDVSGLVIALAWTVAVLQAFDQVGTRDAQRLGHGLHWEPPGRCDRVSKVCFFD
jgi:hypothetical protein